MAQFTQKAIIGTFIELLEKKPFDKITVSEIIKKCEISTNTFYYHFQDIYELLDTCLEIEKNRFIKNTDKYKNQREMIKAMLHDIKDNKKIVYHICDSLSRDRLERYIFESSDESIYNYVKEKTSGKNVSEERLNDITDMCRYVFLGFFLKYLWSQMSFDIDETIDRLSILFDRLIDCGSD